MLSTHCSHCGDLMKSDEFVTNAKKHFQFGLFTKHGYVSRIMIMIDMKFKVEFIIKIFSIQSACEHTKKKSLLTHEFVVIMLCLKEHIIRTAHLMNQGIFAEALTHWTLLVITILLKGVTRHNLNKANSSFQSDLLLLFIISTLFGASSPNTVVVSQYFDWIWIGRRSHYFHALFKIKFKVKLFNVIEIN